MKKYSLKYSMDLVAKVSISLSFALWLEFFYKFGATFDIVNFLGAIPIYFLYLMLLFFTFDKLQMYSSAVKVFLISGIMGICAEWFLIGNAPWSNPHAIQPGMFIFHAFYPCFGFVFVGNPAYLKVARHIYAVFALFTFVCLCGFFIDNDELRFAWFIWLPLFPYFICSIMILFSIIKTRKQY